MELKFYTQFKATAGQDLPRAMQNRLINIEGVAVDDSVNANKWQVPEEDLDFLATSLKGAQLRANHAEDVYQVIGKVPECSRIGSQVLFKAEVADERLIEKIYRGYISAVSIQVDSDQIECSKCKNPTRKEGMLVHLCAGAWEIVHKPRVRELSIVASPAYQHTEFKPAGFSAAMNLSQIACEHAKQPDGSISCTCTSCCARAQKQLQLRSSVLKVKLKLADLMDS